MGALQDFQFKVNIVKLAIRCEFIEGNFKLTKKGRGWFGPKFWRAYNKLMIRISSKHREAMLVFLKQMIDQDKK